MTLVDVFTHLDPTEYPEDASLVAEGDVVAAKLLIMAGVGVVTAVKFVDDIYTSRD